MRGSVKAMRQSFKSFGVGLLLSIVLVYLILMAQFASFVDPLHHSAGNSVRHYRRARLPARHGHELNVMSLMGVLMMTGIVVSNSILIVDVTRSYRTARNAHPRRRRSGLPGSIATYPDDLSGDDTRARFRWHWLWKPAVSSMLRWRAPSSGA